MFHLTLLRRFAIKDKSLGLTEPSGLALASGGDGLWTVSDDTKRILRLDPEGKLLRDHSFEVPVSGLEAITTGADGSTLYAVCEDTNEVLCLDLASEKVTRRRRLADMAGYEAIAHLFAGSDANKGLEGLAWNNDTARLFALKEGSPGLLIEISADLAAVCSHTSLGETNGFVDDDVAGDRLDFSGLCYDTTRRAFWIVSDRARRVFLYDPAAGRVLHSAPLGYAKNGQYRQISKAEGVAYDAQRKRLYVVCDEDARLYVYDVRH
ncbi:MAG: SdiA-regulated domain-containing protein [Pseudomonadota bacterium]